MLTISLEDMKFHSGHGIYPEEKVIGNDFIVDISVSIEDKVPVDHLSQTVDYEKVYDTLSEEMGKVTPMLETLAYSCISKIKEDFPQSKTIKIKISKLHPPMPGEVGKSTITLDKTFDN
ncbi:MAG: dihydroneopterin aldolase [Chitinophagaceae bacterium]|nr:MAG: dihydroneopterin aldolase [Chitinophagaceae bacterium]